MRVSEQITIDAAPAVVWELIREPLAYPRLLRDVTRWDPMAADGDGPPRYRIEVRVGAVELGATVEITRSLAPSEVCWQSVEGVEHAGRWRLREQSDGRCAVSLDLSYGAPDGPLGTLADAAAKPLLRAGVRDSLTRLKAEAEGHGVARGTLASLARSAYEAGWNASVVARSGLIAPTRPDRLVRAAWELTEWDATLAAGCTIAATLHPDDPALVDERGTRTFDQVHKRTNALAHALSERGIGSGDCLAILCRNHAGFAEAVLAGSKLGADVMLLNAGLAAPRLRELLGHDRPRALIYDEEFAGAVDIPDLPRFVAWHGPGPVGATTLEELIAGGDTHDMPPPARHGNVVILTSGTTGAPKGATRPESERLSVPLALLERIPLRSRKVTLIASPLFHSWGYLQYGLAIAVSATVVLQRQFDPEAVLATVADQQVDTLALVPTMLARILELPRAVRARYDTGSLRVVALSGSALQGDLATRFMDEFGDVLFNLYGSTEVAWAAIATPADLRAAPGTVGRPPHGTRVVIYDQLGRPQPAGVPGRIFAGNDSTFDGYLDGGSRETIGGLVNTGDIGHIDDAGRLFVDGRDDEMIVSGGENIFPAEVEDVLARHDGIAEVAVVGVSDERFGQRLKAYVVPAGGAVVSEDELKALLRTTLAPFKVPREIEFVSELPHNEAGKVFKPGLVPHEHNRHTDDPADLGR